MKIKSLSNKAKKSTRLISTKNVCKEQWMKDYGKNLFDILSMDRLKKIASDRNCTDVFDSEYYYDQLDPLKRTKFIEVMKVQSYSNYKG